MGDSPIELNSPNEHKVLNAARLGLLKEAVKMAIEVLKSSAGLGDEAFRIWSDRYPNKEDRISALARSLLIEAADEIGKVLEEE